MTRLSIVFQFSVNDSNAIRQVTGVESFAIKAGIVSKGSSSGQNWDSRLLGRGEPRRGWEFFAGVV